MVRFTSTAMLGTVLSQRVSAMGLEDMVADGMGKNTTVPGDDCAVHYVAGGALCGEVAMSCIMAAPVKAILKGFKDGSCVDAGESIKQIKTGTFAGVTVSAYVGSFAGDDGMGMGMGMGMTLPMEQCAVHFVAGGALCAEAAMSCALVAPVKAILPDFQDGLCADAGESIKQIDTHSFAGVTVSAYVGNFAGHTIEHLQAQSSWPSWPSLDKWPDWTYCHLYNEADDYGIPCGEVKLGCQYVPLVKLLRPFKSGKCAKAGYSVQTHTITVPVGWPIAIGSVTLTINAKTQPSEKQCTVNLAAGVACAQLMSSCDLIPVLKAFVGFEDGECSAASYKLVPGTTGPLIDGSDDVTFSGFIDKALDIPEISGKTCSIFDLGDAFAIKLGVPCGEVSLDCSMVENAKSLRETFKDGVCADAGYTKQTKSHTIWVPLAGDITLKVFGKARTQQILV